MSIKVSVCLANKNCTKKEMCTKTIEQKHHKHKSFHMSQININRLRDTRSTHWTPHIMLSKTNKIK
jgi:hypothetical protein